MCTTGFLWQFLQYIVQSQINKILQDNKTNLKRTFISQLAECELSCVSPLDLLADREKALEALTSVQYLLLAFQ